MVLLPDVQPLDVHAVARWHTQLHAPDSHRQWLPFSCVPHLAQCSDTADVAAELPTAAAGTVASPTAAATTAATCPCKLASQLTSPAPSQLAPCCILVHDLCAGGLKALAHPQGRPSHMGVGAREDLGQGLSGDWAPGEDRHAAPQPP